MTFTELELPGVILVEPRVFGDARGFFMEVYHKARFAAGGIGVEFVQDNHSRSQGHVVRGLHYQLHHPQGKLVRVIVGAIFDVAVDIRRSSPNFGKWTGTVLSAQNRRTLWIPEGFAHGFLALGDDTEVLYKIAGRWARECERAIRWDDPAIGIDWPLTGEAVVSERDRGAPGLSTAEVFV